MDAINFLSKCLEFFRTNFLETIVLLLLFDKLRIFDQLVKWKKKIMAGNDHPHRRAEDNEETVHYHKRDRDAFEELRKEFRAHMEKERVEDVQIGIMSTKIDHMEKRQIRTDENIGKIFTALSNLKDTMIEMGYGK